MSNASQTEDAGVVGVYREAGAEIAHWLLGVEQAGRQLDSNLTDGPDADFAVLAAELTHQTVLSVGIRPEIARSLTETGGYVLAEALIEGVRVAEQFQAQFAIAPGIAQGEGLGVTVQFPAVPHGRCLQVSQLGTGRTVRRDAREAERLPIKFAFPVPFPQEFPVHRAATTRLHRTRRGRHASSHSQRNSIGHRAIGYRVKRSVNA